MSPSGSGFPRRTPVSSGSEGDPLRSLIEEVEEAIQAQPPRRSGSTSSILRSSPLSNLSRASAEDDDLSLRAVGGDSPTPLPTRPRRMGRIFTPEDLRPITGQPSASTLPSADQAVRAVTPTPLSLSRPSSFADQRADPPRRLSTPKDLSPLPPPSTPPKQELKSVWEHSPSPSDWKRTVKGAVKKVGSNLNLRSKKSKADLKDGPKTPVSRKNSWATSQGESSPVPPMPELPSSWRPATTSTSRAAPTPPPRPPRPSTPRFLVHNNPPPVGQYRALGQNLPTGAAFTAAFSPTTQAGNLPAAPPIPPRSHLRPSPTAIMSHSSGIPTPRRPLPQPPVPMITHQQRMPTFPPPVPRLPPQQRTPTLPLPPPIPAPSPPRLQRGRTRSITNLFRRGKQDEERESK